MSRRVKEFVEIADHASIDELIGRLAEIRGTLPADAEAEKEAKARELERLQQELGVVCYAAPGKRGTLRIVA